MANAIAAMQHCAVGLLSLSLLAACGESREVTEARAATPEALQAHSEHFREDVIQVGDRVHVAVGFGIANSILIEGDDGLIVVDVMESLEAARRIAERFRKISDKPVRALIYTHSHPDHVHGGAAFLSEGVTPEIYAHETVAAAVDKIAGVLQPVITRRSLRMYGSLLPEDERSNIGIGGFLDVREGSTLQVLRPTQTFRDELDVTVAGVRMQLVHAPGETDDQIYVWLPEERVLLPGDNFYKAFPNLYTIRGTSYRDPRTWANSLDRMRALGAEHLVPSHGRPLSGAEEIAGHLTDYRDAIRYVNDQTLRLMNAGLTPDEIAPRMQLPPHLAESPYLPFFYGRPDWSARMVFQGQLGWFDGNPTHLDPLPPTQRAQRWLALAGGAQGLLAEMDAAEEVGEWQWVLELSDVLLRVQPDHAVARARRIAALRALGSAESNPNARHYYLMSAAELAGEITLPDRALTPRPEMLAAMPLSVFFDGMAVNLDGEAAWTVQRSVVFEFTDIDQHYTYIVRRGASELLDGALPEADIHVRVDSQAFKEMLAGLRNPALSLVRDFEVVKGGRIGFARFMRLFQPDLDIDGAS
jgi:alkyl sulfatase BDS1-like metallo-beta-lactamase superfamily hydrolase